MVCLRLAAVSFTKPNRYKKRRPEALVFSAFQRRCPETRVNRASQKGCPPALYLLRVSAHLPGAPLSTRVSGHALQVPPLRDLLVASGFDCAQAEYQRHRVQRRFLKAIVRVKLFGARMQGVDEQRADARVLRDMRRASDRILQ